ncbi:AMP-binding protein, partial [Kordiimonas aquimaris]|uniref:AMP-binding protein n=1 Tax=Kordiimonas aquimaris TaxID=707591 RepID=UPI0021D03C58
MTDLEMVIISSIKRREITTLEKNSKFKYTPVSRYQQAFLLENEVFQENVGHPSAYLVLPAIVDIEKFSNVRSRLSVKYDLFSLNIRLKNGRFEQNIKEHLIGELRQLDFSTASDPERAAFKWMKLETEKSFNYNRAPYWRDAIIKISDNCFFYFMTVFHAVLDGAGIFLWFRKLLEAYNSPGSLSELPSRSFLKVLEKDKYIDSKRYFSDRQYWMEQLKGSSDLSSIFTSLKHNRAFNIHAAEVTNISFDQLLYRQIKLFCQTKRIGITSFFLTALNVYLSTLSGSKGMLASVPVHNRIGAIQKDSLGLFLNSFFIRLKFDDLESFGSLAGRLDVELKHSLQHARFPISDFIHAFKEHTNAQLFPDVLFNFQPFTLSEGMGAESVEVKPIQGNFASVPLTLTLTDYGKGNHASLTISHRLDVFSKSSAKRLASNFEVLLRNVLDAPEERISRLPLLSSLERDRLLIEWNDTSAAYASDKCLHTLFEEQASRTPDNIAVVYEGSELSYAELNKRSNQLAHYLIEQGVKPDSLVGLCLDRSLEMVVGIMGILKAGGAYVPLDPDYPEDRLRFMLDDTQAHIVIGQASIATDLSLFDERCQDRPELVLLDEPEQLEALSFYPETNPDTSALGICSDHLAYVIYTSGSTGKPKGVCVEHKSVG